MDYRTEKRAVLAAIAIALLFLVVFYYPLDGAFEPFNFVYLVPVFAVAGSFLSVYAMAGGPAAFLLPSILLYLVNRHAIAVTIWAVWGVISARAAQRNLIKPSFGRAVSAMFGTAFTLMALVSALLVYPSLQFEIPDSLFDRVLDMSSSLYGSALPCGLDATLESCVDELVSGTIASQCGDDPGCIALLKSQEQSLRENLRSNLIEQFPGLDEGKTIRESLRDAIKTPINDILSRYGEVLRVVAAFALVFTFQLVGKLASPLALIGGKFLLSVVKKAGIVKEVTEKVDRIRYEV